MTDTFRAGGLFLRMPWGENTDLEFLTLRFGEGQLISMNMS